METGGLQQTEPEGPVPGAVGAVGAGAVVGAVSEASVTGAGATPGVTNLVAVGANAQAAADKAQCPPKRLHVSNIPFRFRDPDLRTMFGVSIQFYVRMSYWIVQRFSQY